MSGEKTEKATPKKRREETKKGNFVQSKEVVTIISLVVIFNSFRILAGHMIDVIQLNMKTYINLTETIVDLEDALMTEFFVDGARVLMLTAVPLLLISCLVGIVASGYQTKFKVSWSKIKFKASNMDLIKGIGKMFSLKGIVELLKSIAKVTVLTVMAYNQISKELSRIIMLYDMSDTSLLMSLVGEIILGIVNSIIPIFIFIALFDYAYKFYEHEKGMKMSKQEIKEEYKQMEGDPQIKGKIKQKQQMMAQKRMMQAVPEADVVIRNPTHFAIALKYDPQNFDAPIVLAKGIDNIALKIVQIAEENDVITYEDKPLARQLYENVEVGQLIPPDFYTVVSQIIIFVYNAKNKTLLK